MAAILPEDIPMREDGTVDLTELARRALEDVVNAIMDAQADELAGDGNRRNGYRDRSLLTPVGEITMRIPKLREGTYFPEDLVRPYSRVDRAVVAAVEEVYVKGLSTRKIERAADELCFGSLSPSRVSRMTSELDEEVAALRSERFEGERFPYLWLDATYVKCRSEGHVRSMANVTAIACDERGGRRFVGFDVVDVESAPSWKAFLKGLRRRGVDGVQLVVSDAHEGLVQAIAETFPGASWQRCIVHLERDVAGWFPKRADRAAALSAVKAVFAERDPQAVRALYRKAVDAVGAISARAGRLLEDAEADALCYLDFPYEHHVRLRTNNVQERANAEIKRRTKVISAFPSMESMERLVGAVLVDVNEEWMEARFMDPSSMEGAFRKAEGQEPAEEVVEAAGIAIAAAVEEARRKTA